MSAAPPFFRRSKSRQFQRNRKRRLDFEPLEGRWLLATFGHVFEDINPDTSDHDALDPIGASGGRVNHMSGIPGDTQTYYAASEFGGLYKSTDGGQSWAHLDSHLPQLTWDVQVDPSNASRVVATSYFDGRIPTETVSGIQVSNDAGATWKNPPTAHPNGPAQEGTALDNTPQAGFACGVDDRRLEPSAFGIAFQPDSPNNVFVGTNCGLAISNNSGATWRFVDPQLGLSGDDGTALDVRDVVVQPAMPGFPLGIVDIMGSDGYFRSIDGGTTWSQPAGTVVNAGSDGRDNDGDMMVDEPGETGTLPTGRSTIAVSPDESYVLFVAASDNDLYESDDAGATWTNLGTPDRRRQGRVQWVQTNQRSDNGMNDVFDVWFGDVGLFRASCTSQNAVGGAPRCPAAATTPAAPPPDPWVGTFTRQPGPLPLAHDDVGDVVFDTTATTDACPMIFSNDGGVYYNADTNSPSCHSPSWEEPDPTPHALWLYGMDCVDIPGGDDHCYLSTQDNGLFASTDAGAANPTWHNTWGADSFDVAADDDTVLYNRGSFGSPGRSFRLFTDIQGAPGLDPMGTEINTYPQVAGTTAGGLPPTFRFSETLANYADDSYVVLTADCTNPSATGGTSNGCPILNVAGTGSDGGVFVTSDITANPIVWTELADNMGNEPFVSMNLVGVQVAVDAGVPTFYVQVGAGDGRSADQVWKYVGTAANGTWTQIDTNLPGNGIGVFGVDPNNSNRLYASADPTGTPGMYFSNDGGVSWNPDTILDNLMQGGGAFSYLNQRGLLSGFSGYPQPSLVVFDAEDSNNIVAGGQDSGVFLSTDNGQSWRLLTDPFGTADDPATPGDDVPHIPRPRFAHFDHGPGGETRVFIGGQGYGLWRITVDFDKASDSLEEGTNNDSIGTATILGSLPEVTLQDLSIHNGADVDYYEYTAHDTGKLVVNTYFDGLLGDLDIRVRDQSGNVIATGTQSPIAPQLDIEHLVIPVVSQEEYFIEVFSSLGHTNCYDLEIENFPAPVPIEIDLLAADDSGRSDSDDVTNEDQGLITIVADLSDFAAEGIDILTPTEVSDAEPGAAVEVFVNGQSVGFATAVSGSDSTLFDFTFGSNSLHEGRNFVTSAVHIFDGKTPQADGRSPLSQPLILTLDTMAPDPPLAPDLLASSDSGTSETDNVTNVRRSAFSGNTERNAVVRVRANGTVVGEGRSTSSGVWEITVEPLRDNVYDTTVEVEDLAGNVSDVSAALRVEIDTLAPNMPHLDLVESSDSGRHNDDDITNDNTPDVSATTDDPPATNGASHLIASNLTFRVFDRLENSDEAQIYMNVPLTSATQVTPTLPMLADGIHNLKLEVEDRAGNISHDFLLDVLIDTIAPSGTANLFPDSDTGIWGFPETMTDLVTADMTPLLYGATEANALVRASIDDTPGGTAVAIPYDGDDAFPPPSEFDGNYFLQTILNLEDGEHTIEVFFRDVAGNESPADEDATLVIFVDTQGPRITNVTRGVVSADNVFSFDGMTSVFEPKPSETGPDPLVHSIVIHFSDLPDRTEEFADVDALFLALAQEEGNYSLKGDHNGDIAIVDVNVTFTTDPGDGSPEEADVELIFGRPLPDDRYTLWVSDSIADPAGNPLDGESGALGPFDGNDVPDETPPIFPTGDGQHGGDFHARFTVDSRPEIGTFALGTTYLDINGNFVFDSDGQDRDYTNRDVVFVFGFRDDIMFAGNFSPEGALSATGYDKLGAYGTQGQGAAWHWRLDFDHDGVIDYDVLSGKQMSGDPVAGNFSAAHPGDEIGLFNAGKWFLDTTGNNNIGDPGDLSLNGNMHGFPVVGDFDGDGLDDLGTWNPGNEGQNTQGVFEFDLAANGLTGDVEHEIAFDLSGVFEHPVAADMNGDGIDDLGLYVSRREAVFPEEAGEWFFLISDVTISESGTVDALNHEFTPVPFGDDIFAQFGDEAARPIVGNFDPPTASDSLPQLATLGDVNRDATIDALFGGRTVRAPGDANEDFQFDQLDVVQVLQAGKFLTGKSATFEEGDWNDDGVFDQLDIVAALQAGKYLQGP